MKLTRNQQGLATFELVLIVAIVAAVAVVGVRVLNAHNTTDSNDTTATAKNAADVSTAPTINSKEDLTKAEATLDQNDPETANTGDTNQLDSQLSAN